MVPCTTPVPTALVASPTILTPLETALPRAPKGLQETLSFLLGVPAPEAGCWLGELVPFVDLVPAELVSVGARWSCFCCLAAEYSPQVVSWIIILFLHSLDVDNAHWAGLPLRRDKTIYNFMKLPNVRFSLTSRIGLSGSESLEARRGI